MKKIMIVALSALLLLSSCLCFTACDNTTDGAELQGFDIDLAKAACAELGIEARFQKISWGAKVNEINSKNIDLIWNGMTITEELQSTLCISEAYMRNQQVAVVKTANVSKYATTALIKSENAKLVAETGSAGAGILSATFADETYVISDSQADALTEVLAGTSDVAIIDSIMAGYYTSTGDYKDKLVVVPNLSFSDELYGIAARKSDTGIIDKINTVLAKLYKDGDTATIAAKYGLSNEIIDCSSYKTTGATDGWDYIEERGKIIIGYTVFAPIAYEK